LIFGGGVSGDAMGSVLGDACVIEFSKLTRLVCGRWIMVVDKGVVVVVGVR
jgi:hypothetical protein